MTRCGGSPGKPGTFGGSTEGSTRWYCEGCEDCKKKLADLTPEEWCDHIYGVTGGSEPRLAEFEAAVRENEREQRQKELLSELAKAVVDDEESGTPEYLLTECPECEGTGEIWTGTGTRVKPTKVIPCDLCHGTGKIDVRLAAVMEATDHLWEKVKRNFDNEDIKQAVEASDDYALNKWGKRDD